MAKDFSDTNGAQGEKMVIANSIKMRLKLFLPHKKMF
jgi:hypothetical protein